MADTTFRNVINGELVDAASGETLRRHRPDHRRGLRNRPDVRQGGPRPRLRRRREGLRGVGPDDAEGPRRRRCSRSPTKVDERVDEINAVECKDTGKPIGLTMSEEMPYASDHFRFFAGASRVLEGQSAGEYMEDHTSFVRREPIGVVGQVTPWNYPLLMMIWKVAPALAAGNSIVLKPSDTTPRLDDAVRRAVPGVPAAGRVQRRLRRPRHRPRPGGAPDPADGRDHRLGARRHGGGQVRRRGPEEGAPRARRQGAGDRLRRRRHREGRPGHRRGRLLQRRPGLHRGDPGARRPRGARRLRGSADRGGQGDQDRDARRRGRPLRPAEQQRPARSRDRDGRPAARPRRTSRPAAPARATRATSTRPPCCPG